MKFVYTDAALQELQMFQTHQKKILEEIISERKFVFGDETVEVTASDIKEAAEFIRVYRPRVTRYSPIRLASRIYVIIGAIMTLVAYFYPKIQLIFKENRVQAMAFIIGVSMMMIGLLIDYFYRQRARRYEEMRRNILRHIDTGIDKDLT